MKFTRLRKTTSGILAAIAATLLFETSIARAAEKGPLRINFEKCFVGDPDDELFGGYYAGTASGDFGVGTVIFTFASLAAGATTPAGEVIIWQFSGIYTITTPQGVISAFASGIDNLRSGSGHDVLNGVVIAGAHVGAQVQVRAHDTKGGACSEGTITITPSK
jgi:hypothetical protein